MFNLDSPTIAEPRGIEAARKFVKDLEHQPAAELLRLPPMKRKRRASRALRAGRKAGRATGAAWTSSRRRPASGRPWSREFPEGASEPGRGRPPAVHEDHGGLVRPRAGSGLPGAGGRRRTSCPSASRSRARCPGLPVYYATAMPLRRWAVPLLAETHQGRPTKLEGNPTYAPHGRRDLALRPGLDPRALRPGPRDGAHPRRQAGSTRRPSRRSSPGSARRTRPTRGDGLAFLADESSSHTRSLLVRYVRGRFPKADLGRVRARGRGAPGRGGADGVRPAGEARLPLRRRRSGSSASTPTSCRPRPAASTTPADFADGRRVTKKDDPMNRLYMAESALSITGTMADHRLRLASGHMLAFAAALALRVTGNTAFAIAAGGSRAAQAGGSRSAPPTCWRTRASPWSSPGAHLPADVHAIAYAINEALGSIGRTVEFVIDPRPPVASIRDLASAIGKGAVKTLIILGGNPVYNAPADLDWAAAPEVGAGGDPHGLLRRRDLARWRAPTSRRPTTSSPGATPGRSTGRSCRSSR